MKRKSLFILLFCSLAVSGQNIMSLSSATLFRGDTAEVELKINNAQQFVAFQTDINFPAELTPIPSSGSLTGRSNGHAFSCQFVPGNACRIIAFSLTQTPFSGDSGAVFSLKVIAGNITGTYVMRISDPVISNANSQNILTGSSNGYITIIDSVVKVELVSFTALQNEENHILLNWETSSEENSLRFQIERITESPEMFRSFIVNASGTSTVPRTYNFTDDVRGISGTILYRLWEEDANGTRTLLGEKEIKISSTEQGLMLFQNYPNPFSTATQIKFRSEKDDNIIICIFNSLGEKVYEKLPQMTSGGVETILWDGKDNLGVKVSQGVYYLTLSGAKNIKSLKLIRSE